MSNGTKHYTECELMMEYEKKLMEIMGEEEYLKWSTEVAQKMFKAEVEAMEDGDFKQFCLDNMPLIFNGKQ